MPQIVIRYISGSKANQEEIFDLDTDKTYTLGRDPSSDIAFDPEQDDLVSRHHAEVRTDPADPEKFVISDLNSRNGLYVNQIKVEGNADLHHGDMIQLGKNGPEIMFELDPPPAAILRATRIAESPTEAMNQTRESTGLGTALTRSGETKTVDIEDVSASTAPASSDTEHRPVGRATVEHLISSKEKQSKKTLINGIAATIGIIALVSAFFIYKNMRVEKELGKAREELAQAGQKIQAADTEIKNIQAVMTPREVADNFSKATVYLETSWKLIDTVSGRQIYHRYATFNRKRLPAYIRLSDGVIEPWLITDDENGTNTPIGGTLRGSGFVVTENGFVLTNRHVAAPWLTSSQPRLPGYLFGFNGRKLKLLGTLTDPGQGDLFKWVPAKSKLLGGQSVGPKRIEGRHDTLDATFPKTNLRIPAKLVRISNEHDVALLKIDTPVALKKVELYDNYNDVRPGDPITILGYPAISSQVAVVTKSQDMFNPVSDVAIVPDPTVTPGVIGKVVRGTASLANADTQFYMSSSDTYQLTATATGFGNSGGPVFDEHGRVIGIFYAGRKDEMATKVTYAVPIKYGMALMSITPVMK